MSSASLNKTFPFFFIAANISVIAVLLCVVLDCFLFVFVLFCSLFCLLLFCLLFLLLFSVAEASATTMTNFNVDACMHAYIL